MWYDLVQHNFTGVVITLFLVLFIMTNNNFEKRTNRLFLASACCVFLLVIEEAWEAELGFMPTFQPLRIPLSAIGYTLRPLIVYFLVIMLYGTTRKKSLLLSIPIVFNTVVSFSALFCGIAFSYTPDNQFVRGPLGLTPFIVAGGYIVVLLYLTLQQCKKGSFTEALIVSAIVLLAFTSTILESIFHFRAIQNACMGISLTYYYLFLHSNRNNRDALTNALTRRRFYLDAERYRTSLTAVISLDLNDLKTLNDQYGHTAGDTALIEFTQIIKRSIGVHASLYRIGGDEFMILCYKTEEAAVQQIIERVQSELQKSPYRCAIGYSMYSHEMELDHVCQVADHAMYENKRQMKQAH